MATKISNVLYVKVGNITVTKLENQKRQELISGIKKYPVGKAYLTKSGFADDFQADLVHHGGVNKALFLFSSLTYEKINSSFDNSFDIAFIKGKKSLLFDKNKKDYIDFASGVGVNSLGYANKKLAKTVEKQAKKVLHSSNIYRIKPQEECAKKIVELSTYDMQCFFVIVEQKQMKLL